MPQLQAAKKALRVAARKRVVNDRWRRQLREALYAIRDAIAAGKKSEAQKALLEAQSIVDRAARRHILHPNKAARKKSQLQRAVAKMKK
jgi:small subunit ribosomal protein S20